MGSNAPTSCPKLLADYPVVIHMPVEWGDQDPFRHVNNIVYLRWCETARVVYLQRIGMWRMIAEENKGPILAALSCNYRRPVEFPDTVHIGARITRIGNSSFGMEHLIVSETMNEVVADADSTLVFFDYAANQPLPLPDDLRGAIETLEGKEL
jgi:acyl-CoA thioester hydrolase